MKLAGLLEVINTYKMYDMKFLPWWPKDQVNFVTSPLPISQWGNMKMLPVSHKLIETSLFIQDHRQSPHLCRSGCN